MALAGVEREGAGAHTCVLQYYRVKHHGRLSGSHCARALLVEGLQLATHTLLVWHAAATCCLFHKHTSAKLSAAAANFRTQELLVLFAYRMSPDELARAYMCTRRGDIESDRRPHVGWPSLRLDANPGKLQAPTVVPFALRFLLSDRTGPPRDPCTYYPYRRGRRQFRARVLVMKAACGSSLATNEKRVCVALARVRVWPSPLLPLLRLTCVPRLKA